MALPIDSLVVLFVFEEFSSECAVNYDENMLESHHDHALLDSSRLTMKGHHDDDDDHDEDEEDDVEAATGP